MVSNVIANKQKRTEDISSTTIDRVGPSLYPSILLVLSFLLGKITFGQKNAASVDVCTLYCSKRKLTPSYLAINVCTSRFGKERKRGEYRRGDTIFCSYDKETRFRNGNKIRLGDVTESFFFQFSNSIVSPPSNLLIKNLRILHCDARLYLAVRAPDSLSLSFWW